MEAEDEAALMEAHGASVNDQPGRLDLVPAAMGADSPMTDVE